MSGMFSETRKRGGGVKKLRGVTGREENGWHGNLKEESGLGRLAPGQMQEVFKRIETGEIPA